ncbi:MAG TPA: hypothetical protein VFW16_16345 [Streptosporangiaceae bacterium]|nr:hypothetical protein [Streptosporangiaceae bacterium]
MKITRKLAAATLVPAAVAGITVSSFAVVQASTDQPADPLHRAAAANLDQKASQAQSDMQARAAGHARMAAHHGSRKQPSSHQAAVDHVRRSKVKAHRAARAKAHRRAHAKPAPTPTSMFAGMSAFERCVAWRESGDNPAASSAGLFGILPSTWASLGYQGTAGTSSVALQKQAFDRLYAMDGTAPWAPYDGC